MKLFRVFYEETLSYEDYVEALTPEQAKTIFIHTLEQGDGNDLEPTDMDIVEFDAEEVTEFNSPIMMS